MNKVTKYKEAIKVGLAFAIVYGIAMKISWMNPYWAAFGVAMIALPTAGQSLHKGLDRVAGTITGAIAGLVIFSISPQNRWWFMVLAALWLGFTAYKMIRSKYHPYFWNVAGFVCLIILTTAPINSYNIFNHALYRALETAMGVLTYTLITVFLWPINNYGTIKKTSKELLSVQLARFQTALAVIHGQEEPGKINELGQLNTLKLSQLNTALIAEGSENYEVREVKPLLERFTRLSSSMLDMQNRFESSLEEFSKVSLQEIFPELGGFIKYFNDRYQDMLAAIDGNRVHDYREIKPLNFDKQALDQYPEFDKAAMVVGHENLAGIYRVSEEIYDCVMELTGNAENTNRAGQSENTNQRVSKWIFMPDGEALKNALFASLATILGFCVWIFFNPTGHSGWFTMAGTIALVIISSPQSKIIGAVPAAAIIFPLGILAYVFIMPHLSTYFELALLLFSMMFLVHYFLPPSVRVFGQLAIINMMVIQNHQVYSFATVFNGYLFTLAVITFCYALSYMISAPRPEKVVLKSIHRFFAHAEFLLSQMVKSQDQKQTFMRRWRNEYIFREMRFLPARIDQWSMAINYQLYPDITPEQIGILVTSLRRFVYRFDELNEAKEMIGNEESVTAENELRNDLISWNNGLIQVFSEWSVQPGKNWGEDKRETVKSWLDNFESRVESSITKLSGPVSEKDLERYYRLLGSYRGLSLAVANYALIAPGIDFKSWSEERFS